MTWPWRTGVGGGGTGGSGGEGQGLFLSLSLQPHCTRALPFGPGAGSYGIGMLTCSLTCSLAWL